MDDKNQKAPSTATGMPGDAATAAAEPMLTVFVVDDDPLDRDRLAIMLGRCGYRLRLFPTAEAFLDIAGPGLVGCVVADLRLPLMSGLELLVEAQRKGLTLPFLIVSAYGDINAVRQVFHEGAVDFLQKPVETRDLLAGIEKCFHLERQRIAAESASARREDFLDVLTEREREVATLAARGHSNRQVGDALGISHRTVEVHKARIMSKLGIRTTAELIRIASQLDLAAPSDGSGELPN